MATGHPIAIGLETQVITGYPKRLAEIAYHEAGHAVASHFLDIEYRYATINPDEDSLGHVRYEEPSPPFRELDFFEAFAVSPETMTRAQMAFVGQLEEAERLRERDNLEKHMLISLAGGLAQRRIRGRSDHRGARRDYGNTVDAALLLTQHDPKEAYLYQRLLRYRAERMVLGYWHFIEAVALELLEKRTLQADEVAAIISRVSDQRMKAATEQARPSSET
jgi:hypothetical protein